MEGIQTKSRKGEKGFTLVELAVVMIIIGLLIGGILKGQELIANAQITATVAQIKGIDAAVSTFRDAYDALPGDMANPTVRLSNCANECAQAGNGDSRVSEGGAEGAGDAPTSGGENVAFFTHMAAADLITGVSADPDNAAVTFGEDLPETEIGASGFFIGFEGAGTPTSLIGADPMRGGHYLGIAAAPDADMAAVAGAEALTSSQAARIDRKLDDGMPNTGTVRAGGNAACTEDNTSTGAYDEAVDQNNCNLFVRVQG